MQFQSLLFAPKAGPAERRPVCRTVVFGEGPPWIKKLSLAAPHLLRDLVLGRSPLAAGSIEIFPQVLETEWCVCRRLPTDSEGEVEGKKKEKRCRWQ